MLGFRPSLELLEVTGAVALHFHIVDELMTVTMHALGKFVFLFEDPKARREELHILGPLTLGPVSFMLLPCMRFRKATTAAMH